MTKRFQKVNADQIGLIVGEDFVSEFPVIDPDSIVEGLDRECPDCHYRWAGSDVRLAIIQTMFDAEVPDDEAADASKEPDTTCPRCRRKSTFEEVYALIASPEALSSEFRRWPK